MARIPEYQAKPLASDAVGAPPIDTSGQRMGESLANNLEQVSQVRYAKQQLSDKIAADAKVNDFALKLQEERNAIHKSYYGTDASPEQEVEAISKKAKDLQTEYTKNLSTAGQKTAFSMQSMDVIKSHQSSGYEQALTRQTQQTHQNSVNALNSISDLHSNAWADPTLSEAQKYEVMSQLTDKASLTLANARKFLPADQFAKLKEDWAKSFSKAAIFGALQSDPEQAKKLLDDRVFENHLDTRDEIELGKYADAAIEKKEKQEALNIQFTNNHTTQTLWQGLHKGTTRLQDIEQALVNGDIKKPEHTALSKLVFNKNLLDPSEKLDVYNQLNDEQNKLFEKDSSGKVTATKEATLDSIALLRQHVMEAERVGAITQAKAQSFYRATTPFQDDASFDAMKASVLNRKTGFDFFGHWIGTYKIGSEKEQEAAKAHLTLELSKQIDNAESSGVTVTPAVVKDMSQTILKDYITQNYPETINAKDTPNSVITAKGGPQQLHSMPAEATGAQKVTASEPAVPKYDPNTQVLLYSKKLKQYKVVQK